MNDRVKEGLEVMSNAAEVITALVVAFAFIGHLWARHEKRRRLVECLKAARNDPFEGWHNPTYLMAHLGIAEDEVLQAAFGNKLVEDRPVIQPDPKDPQVGHPVAIQFRYKSK